MEKPFTLDRQQRRAGARRGGAGRGRARRRLSAPLSPRHARAEGAHRRRPARHDRALLREQNAPAGLFMDPRSWRADPHEAPAGGMTAMGVHNLDAMIHLFGEIDEVYCVEPPARRRLRRRGHDQRHVRLRQRHVGEPAVSLVTAVSYRLAVFGTKGCAELVTPELDFRFTPAPDAMPTGRHVAADAGDHREPRLQRAARRAGGVCRGDRRRARPTRSRPRRSCTASPCSRRSSARPRRASRSRSRATGFDTERNPDARYRALSRSPPAARTSLEARDLRPRCADREARHRRAVGAVRRRLRRGRRADDHGLSGHRRRSGAVSAAARDRAHGGRLRQARPAGRGGAQHPDLQRARLRHDRGRRPRDRAGADAAARHPPAPRIAAEEPAGAVALVPGPDDPSGSGRRPSASSGSAGSARRWRCAPRRSISASCSTTPICRTGSSWRSASTAPRRSKTCCARPTRCRSTRR